MDGIRLAVRHLLYNGHDVSVGMLNGVEAQFPVFVNGGFEIRDYQLVECLAGKEGVYVEAVIGAKGKAVQQMAVSIELCSEINGPFKVPLGFFLEFFRLFVH